MYKTNAFQVRQNLGVVLKRLSRGGRPVLVEKNRKPAAVLISLEDYQRRFADYDADIRREEVIDKIKKAKIRLPKGQTSLSLVRQLRAS